MTWNKQTNKRRTGKPNNIWLEVIYSTRSVETLRNIWLGYRREVLDNSRNIWDILRQSEYYFDVVYENGHFGQIWAILGPQSGAKVVITEWGMFQMGILFILKYTLLVKNRHFHCKIYRNLSKIWKKRLVQVKHIYSGSLFPGNKITSVYRSWHRFCQKSRFSEKSKIQSNGEILREISQESIEICTLCLPIQ